MCSNMVYGYILSQCSNHHLTEYSCCIFTLSDKLLDHNREDTNMVPKDKPTYFDKVLYTRVWKIINWKDEPLTWFKLINIKELFSVLMADHDTANSLSGEPALV